MTGGEQFAGRALRDPRRVDVPVVFELTTEQRAVVEDLPDRAEVLPFEEIKELAMGVLHAAAPDGTPECDADSKNVTEDPTSVNCAECLDLIQPWIQGTAEI